MESDSSQSSSESPTISPPPSPSISPSPSNPELNQKNYNDIRTSDTDPDYSYEKQKKQIISTSKNLLDFLEKEDFEMEDLNKFIKYLDDEKILSDKYKFKTFLHLLTKISENHFRNKHFNEKITQILYKLSDEIKKYFSNFTIWNIFKKNLLILRKLLDKEIIYYNISIMDKLIKLKYKEKYRAYLTQKAQSNEDPATFEQKINIGENDQYLCQLIREDLVEEFIIHVEKTNIPLKSAIKDSIFETNRFLYKKPNVTLIEYATFYGSIQIFKYLHIKGVELTQSLWMYAIHSNNPEIISILEENHVKKDYDIKMICESIKCFHVDIMNYMFETMEVNDFLEDLYLSILKNYNFIDLFDSISEKSAQIGRELDYFTDYKVPFYCEYDYLTVIDFLAKSNDDRQLPGLISFNLFF